MAVIMSLYASDRAEFVKEAVDSILNQSYDRFDFYIICDGPVKKEVDEYVGSLADDRLHVLKRDRNLGLARSLNELLQVVLPEGYSYIARMDADDVCFADRFQRQIEFMDAHPQIDICGGFIEEMTENGTPMAVVKYPLTHDGMKAFFGRRNPLAHITVLFRRSYFAKAGLYPTDTNKDEDTMFWLKGFLSGCVFANVDAPLAHVRVNDDFYCRRNGFDKSWGDFKNRCAVIRSLRLSPVDYLFAFGRFVFFILPMPWLTRLAYRYLR
ncbi:MAG: glycosyltransferase [Alistipes sp.]|nr:glycosyltransferase [Alistipes sp.]